MATSADWSAWLQQGQGQNVQANPLAPLNQQFGPLSGAPAQGYGQTSIAAPSDWTRWRSPGNAERLPFQNLGYMNEYDPGSGGGGGSSTGAANGAQNAASGVSTGGNANSQSTAPVPTPTPTPTPQAGGGAQQQPLTAGVMPKIADSNLPWQNNTNGGGGDWYNKIPEWTRGGGYPVGYTWTGSGWTPKGPQAAGTLVGDEAGWHTGLYLPSTYNPAGDTSSFESSTGAEKANARAIRQTADYMRANPGANAQHYFEYVLANLVRDQGSKTGYDPRQFAVTKYGEAYDPQKTYMAKGVSNPWTGKQAGNATGQDTSQPNLLMGSDTGQGQGQGQVPTDTSTKPPLPAGGTVPPVSTSTPQAGGGTWDGKGFHDDAVLNKVRDDPEAALAFWQGQQGGRDKSGAMGTYRDNLMSRALQAYLSTVGVGGNDAKGGFLGASNQGLQDMLGRFAGGQGVGNFLRENAGRMMNGIDFSNMDNDQIQNILNLAGGAANFGGGPLSQYAFDNAAKDLKYTADQQFFNGGGKTAALADPRNRQQFTDLLAKWLNMQQGG